MRPGTRRPRAPARRASVDLISRLRRASDAYLQIYAAEAVPSKRLDREHREILAACAARDPERAARAIRHHLSQTVAYFTDRLADRTADHRSDGDG